jgi:hypothetical protein
MSNIIINSENFKRFSKRLQKKSEQYGVKLSLSEAQELLSQTFGATNFFEMQTMFEKASISKEASFIAKYREIINNEPAIKKSYIYVDYGNMIIDIVGHMDELSHSIYFGSEITDTVTDFRRIGIPLETCEKLVTLFNEYNPVEKYAGLLFGSNVRKIMIDEQGDKEAHYFKNILLEHEKKIDGQIYSKRYMVVSDKYFKSIMSNLDLSGRYCIMKSDRYAGFDDQKTALKKAAKSDSIAIEYYYELHADTPKCLMSRFWTSIDGILEEYQPSDYKLNLSSY